MKNILLISLLIVVIFILSCAPQQKYPDLDYSKCPQQKCPDLDCNSCPKQTEKITITQYQCYDGTVKDKLSDCQKTETQEAQEDCPELNMFKPKQNMFDDNLYSIHYEEDKVYDGWKIQCVVSCSTNCRKGEKEGENVNYYYCGKNSLDSFTLEKTITDKDGKILEVVTKDVVIIFDKSFNYIKTTCNS